MEQSPGPPELSIGRAAKYAHVDPGTIKNWLDQGFLRGYTIGPGRIVRIRREDIDAAFRPYGQDSPTVNPPAPKADSRSSGSASATSPTRRSG
jgi:excisionase family DNA binding protein